MSRTRRTSQFGVDSNGCPTELVVIGDQEVLIHYDDIPESDITIVDGLRCTTPLRTVIDLAPDLDRTELENIVRECLERELFTVQDALERVSRPDMTTRPGSAIIRQLLSGT